MLNVQNTVAPKVLPVVNFKSNPQTNIRKVNFKAGNDSFSVQSMYDNNDIQKEYKAQKRKNNIASTVAIGSGIAIILMVLAQFGLLGKAGSKGMQKELGIKDPIELLKSFFKDTQKSRSLKELSLPEELNGLTERIISGVNNIEEAVKKGGSALKTVFLYGPPGTGKTSYAEAIAKELKAKFYCIQMSGLNSPMHGVTEQNIKTAIDAVCQEADKLAKSGSKEKIVVFLDEIDTVMMADKGMNNKLSNDILNQFKLCFNDLLKRDNITVIGATNLEIDAEKAMLKNGKSLDDAMLSRFKEKILVDFPCKQQLIDATNFHYKDCEMVDDILKSKDNKKLDKIFEILSKKEHGVSFRTLESIFDDTYLASKKGKNVTIDDFINTIVKKYDDIHLTSSEIDELAKLTSTGKVIKPKNIKQGKIPTVTEAEASIIADGNNAGCEKCGLFNRIRNLFHKNNS